MVCHINSGAAYWGSFFVAGVSALLAVQEALFIPGVGPVVCWKVRSWGGIGGCNRFCCGMNNK
jgi:hypothetical protein